MGASKQRHTARVPNLHAAVRVAAVKRGSSLPPVWTLRLQERRGSSADRQGRGGRRGHGRLPDLPQVFQSTRRRHRVLSMQFQSGEHH